MIKFLPLRTVGLLILYVASICNMSNLSAQILVAGTTFNPSAGNAGRTYIGLNDIVQYGVQSGSITSTPVIAPNVNANVFNANYYYAITDNPYKLDNTRYTNLATPDYMYVFGQKPSGGNTNVLEYVVKGMLPNSAVSVTVDYCSVVSSTLASCNSQRNEFKAGINLDAFNQLNGTDAPQIGMGQCQTRTFTGTVAANGDMIFRINATMNGNGSCQAMGLQKIDVNGFIKPVIISNMGAEVCVGEQISLQPTQNYNASFQWQVNTGSGWGNVSGGTNQSLLYEVAAVGNYQFRLVVTPSVGAAVTTDPVSVSAITCCQIGSPPVSASRQTVYYDNFGRLDMSDKTGTKYFTWDYTNVLNPVEVARTTTTPFRWPITPAPLGATFVGAPTFINDGEYTVAAYITGYNAVNGYDGALLRWANNVKGLSASPSLSYDHSGIEDGGALFLNCPINTGGQVLYSRTINNLCFGKQLFFECYIAVFTNSASGTYNPVNIRVNLTEVGNPTNTVSTIATATREADGGGVWVRVAAQINLVSGNSLQMDIINNQNVSANGNDLVLDDIRILACAPPAVNLYFDLATASEATTLCANGASTLPLVSKASNLLKAFYGNAPLFLYQWTKTPSVNTSWTNLGTPVSAEFLNLNNFGGSAPFLGLNASDKIYFRVIAASAATFTANTNFTAPNYANANDPCKSYSVSEPIVATVLCPLPVNLISFKAWPKESINVLQWITSNEKDNDHFVIERSNNNLNFTAIATINPLNNGQGTKVYEFEDETPLEGTNYYRLKQVDKDGSTSYSKVISVLAKQSATLDFNILPNPSDGNVSLILAGIADIQTLQIEVTDLQGNIVYQSVKTSEGVISLALNNLAKGIYIVKIENASQILTKKLVIY